MPKKELNPEEAVEQAIEDLRVAMLKKIKADKVAIDATLKQQKARYELQTAKDRLSAVERDFK